MLPWFLICLARVSNSTRGGLIGILTAIPALRTKAGGGEPLVLELTMFGFVFERALALRSAITLSWLWQLRSWWHTGLLFWWGVVSPWSWLGDVLRVCWPSTWPPESFLLTSPSPTDTQATLGPKLTTYTLPHTPSHHLANQTVHTTTPMGVWLVCMPHHYVASPPRTPLAYSDQTQTKAMPKDPARDRNA